MKKRQVREMLARSRSAMSFQSFAGPESQKVGSLMWVVRGHAARSDMKENFQAAVVARSTFPSQNAQAAPAFGGGIECVPFWREANFQVKTIKARGSGPFGRIDAEKRT